MLRSDEEPPRRGDWLLVHKGTSELFETACSTAHILRESNIYVPLPAPDGDLDTAISRAVEWARSHRFKRVFVRP